MSGDSHEMDPAWCWLCGDEHTEERHAAFVRQGVADWKAGRSTSCPPCDDGVRPGATTDGHQYDDDWPFMDDDLRFLAPGSRVGDPCVWCDHEKCAACPSATPPARGAS